MPKSETPPRLSVDITQEQFNKMQKLIPYGQKKVIFGHIVDNLIELLETEEPYIVCGAIKSGNIKLRVKDD